MLLGCWNKELLSVKGVINYWLCWQVICPCIPSAEKLQVWENYGRGKRDVIVDDENVVEIQGTLEGRDEGRDFLTVCKDYQHLRGLQIQFLFSLTFFWREAVEPWGLCGFLGYDLLGKNMWHLSCFGKYCSGAWLWGWDKSQVHGLVLAQVLTNTGFPFLDSPVMLQWPDEAIHKTKCEVAEKYQQKNLEGGLSLWLTLQLHGTLWLQNMAWHVLWAPVLFCWAQRTMRFFDVSDPRR